MCLDIFGKHAIQCRKLSIFKYLNDIVRDAIFDIFRRTIVSVKKETSLNFLTDPHEGRLTLKSMDILVSVHRREICMCGLDRGFSTGGIGD